MNASMLVDPPSNVVDMEGLMEEVSAFDNNPGSKYVSKRKGTKSKAGMGEF